MAPWTRGVVLNFRRSPTFASQAVHTCTIVPRLTVFCRNLSERSLPSALFILFIWTCWPCNCKHVLMRFIYTATDHIQIQKQFIFSYIILVYLYFVRKFKVKWSHNLTYKNVHFLSDCLVWFKWNLVKNKIYLHQD